MNCKIFFFFGIFVLAIAQEVSERNSFSPPFNKYGWSGNRRINGWTCGGDASIMEYFIRLTPDRQSKSGYCWNDNSINSSKWVTQVKFRISGQGENLFGDGMTIFFTNKGYHDNGDMHGTDDHFLGFAINLPTFRNPSYIRYHRDVSLYIGNNTVDSVYKPNEFHSGCYANYRYHEKRQDFNVDSASSIRISYDSTTNRIKVDFDEKNQGSYISCIDETVVFPADWWKTVYVGVSASTGDLADNHDLLEVITYPDINALPEVPKEVAEAQLEKEKRAQLENLLKSENIDTSMLNPKEYALFALVKELYDKQQQELAQTKRELEHSMAAIDDSINTMIRKLQQRGDSSDTRISELENILQKRVSGSISMQIQERVSALEKMLDTTLKSEVSKKSFAWIIPFAILALVLAFIFGFAYKQYKHLQKTHML